MPQYYLKFGAFASTPGEGSDDKEKEDDVKDGARFVRLRKVGPRCDGDGSAEVEFALRDEHARVVLAEALEFHGAREDTRVSLVAVASELREDGSAFSDAESEFEDDDDEEESIGYYHYDTEEEEAAGGAFRYIDLDAMVKLSRETGLPGFFLRTGGETPLVGLHPHSTLALDPATPAVLVRARASALLERVEAQIRSAEDGSKRRTEAQLDTLVHVHEALLLDAVESSMVCDAAGVVVGEGVFGNARAISAALVGAPRSNANRRRRKKRRGARSRFKRTLSKGKKKFNKKFRKRAYHKGQKKKHASRSRSHSRRRAHHESEAKKARAAGNESKAKHHERRADKHAAAAEKHGQRETHHGAKHAQIKKQDRRKARAKSRSKSRSRSRSRGRSREKKERSDKGGGGGGGGGDQKKDGGGDKGQGGGGSGKGGGGSGDQQQQQQQQQQQNQAQDQQQGGSSGGGGGGGGAQETPSRDYDRDRDNSYNGGGGGGPTYVPVYAGGVGPAPAPYAVPTAYPPQQPLSPPQQAPYALPPQQQGVPPGYLLDSQGRLVPAPAAATTPAQPQPGNANNTNTNTSSSTSNNTTQVNVVLKKKKDKKKEEDRHRQDETDDESEREDHHRGEEDEDSEAPPLRAGQAAAGGPPPTAPVVRAAVAASSPDGDASRPHALAARIWPALARRAQDTYRTYGAPGTSYNPAWNSRIRDVVERAMRVDEGGPAPSAQDVAEMAAEAGARVTEFIVDRVLAERRRQERKSAPARRVSARLIAGSSSSTQGGEDANAVDVLEALERRMKARDGFPLPFTAEQRKAFAARLADALRRTFGQDTLDSESELVARVFHAADLL
jgi:hypothetical protein